MIDLLAIARRRLEELPRYRSHADWLLSLYNRMLLRPSGSRLPFRGHECSVQLSRARNPMHVRLGTSDWHVLEELYFRQEYAFVLCRKVNPLTIVDLGANIGLSVRLWQEAYPQARIVAIEPDPENMSLCRKNASLNENVQFIEACAAEATGFVYLDRAGEPWAYKMRHSGEGATVRSISMPEILSLLEPTEEVDLLKCDIEGAEAELFANCRGWIDRIRAIAVEVHHPYTIDRMSKDVGTRFGVAHAVQMKERGIALFERTVG